MKNTHSLLAMAILAATDYIYLRNADPNMTEHHKSSDRHVDIDAKPKTILPGDCKQFEYTHNDERVTIVARNQKNADRKFNKLYKS
jgi:hypothetical protein